MTRRYGPVAGDQRADVLVLGGGLAGCAAAYELARRGRSVVLLEPDSMGSGPVETMGHLATGPAVPYLEAVARLGHDGAVRVWEAFREGHWKTRDLLTVLGREHGYRADGGFLVAEDRPQGIALAESEDALRDDGFAGEFLDHYMLEARFDVTGFAAAYWAMDDGVVDGPALVRDLADRAAGAGALIHESSPVLALETGTSGVEAACPGAAVIASCALVADDRAACLVPALASRLTEWREAHVEMRNRPGSALPTPACSLGGARWRVRDGEVRVAWREEARQAGPGLAILGRLGGLAPADPRRTPASGSRDGLPLVGVVGGAPVAAACALGDALAMAVLAASWAVEAITTGRDPTPAPFRAMRP